MKKLAYVLVGLMVMTGLAAPAQATQGVAKKYSSCADLLEKYPNGVAKNKKARNKAVKGGFAKPKVSKKLYKKKSLRLDRDKDGVMCEQEGFSRASQEPFPDLVGSAMQKPWCEGELLRLGDVSKLTPACVLVLYGN